MLWNATDARSDNGRRREGRAPLRIGGLQVTNGQPLVDRKPAKTPGRIMGATRAVKQLVLAVLASVVLAAPTVVFADGRVALVVGNSTYANIGRLPNPENDAADVSAALRRLGFEVTTEFDADRVELTDALRAFTRKSAGADVSAGLLRRPRHRDGRRQLLGAGRRAA